MKSNLDTIFKTNKNFEREGVDFLVKEKDDEAGTERVAFRLRRFNGSNPRVKAAMAAYYKPYARQIEMDTLPPEKGDELAIRLFIDVCLVSWEGVMDSESGKPLEFSKDNAFKLFKSLPELFGTLQKYSNDFQNYREDLGNF